MLAIPPPCGPPCWTALPDGVDGWLVTRHADARTVLADPRFVRYPVRVGRGDTLLRLNPPQHTRLRRAVGPLFGARRTDAHGSTIDELAETLVARCARSGQADLMCDVAVPLAVGVLCQVTGLPTADYVRFGPWVRQIHSLDSGAGAGRRTIEAITALNGYLEQQLATGTPGVLAELITSSSSDVTEDEVIAIGRDLLVGGYESAANLVAGGLALLLADPSRYRAVRLDPALIPATVEECLRQAPPFPQLEARYASEPVQIGGVHIATGDAVAVNVAAANRDPDRFPGAERWSWEEPTGHLSFGHGAHHCLGAVLARREAQAAFRAVLAGLDDLRLGCRPDELDWAPGLTPTLRSLPVRFKPCDAG